ncbi:hypothetical protein [Amycolatopsis sp. NBC_00438]|uniref:hypothetical protein n=1 Tax=Amycolatopsis sp. NBC_00438 TaxID=2903558 RepID=UPI002E1D015A
MQQDAPEPQRLPYQLIGWQLAREEEAAVWAAYRAAHEAAVAKAADLIRRVEENDIPWDNAKAEFWSIMNSVPSRPVPLTGGQEAEAHEVISEHLARGSK